MTDKAHVPSFISSPSTVISLPISRSSFAPGCRLRSGLSSYNPLRVSAITNRKAQKLAPQTTRCCTEVPAWKRGPVDVDFAKDEQLEILESSLDKAVSQEDFTRAAELHDKVTRLQSGSSVAVLSLNLKFYQSFNNKSVVDMAACWLQSGGVTCKHPGGPLVAGYVNIINSFGMLFTYDIPHLEVRNINIQMRGTVGYVTCQQICGDYDDDGKLVQIKTFATNMFVKHNAQWYLTHHSSFIIDN